jgi:hypothetical protein
MERRLFIEQLIETTNWSARWWSNSQITAYTTTLISRLATASTTMQNSLLITVITTACSRRRIKTITSYNNTRELPADGYYSNTKQQQSRNNIYPRQQSYTDNFL